MISVSASIPKTLPIKQLDTFIDKTVYGIARITLDYTNSKKHFPELTGDLKEASMAQGVTKDGKNSYWLGADETVDYAGIVWEYPKDTHWTNQDTYPQWYVTEFEIEKDKIVKNAISNALRLIK